MKYREFKPSPGFAESVKCYWTLEEDCESNGDVEPIIPDGCPEIIFNLSAPFQRCHRNKKETQPKSIVVGQMKSAVTVLPTGRVDLFGIRFRPHGIAALLRDSVECMTGNIESASTVFGKRGALLEERINEAPNFRERISLFEASFERELKAVQRPDNAIEAVIEMIDADPSGVRIGGIAETVGISLRQLERRFKHDVGLTPKFFARILRIQRLVAGLNQAPSSNWTDICYANGFSDQSHMIREVRAIAGVPPESFVRKAKRISDHFTA